MTRDSCRRGDCAQRRETEEGGKTPHTTRLTPSSWDAATDVNSSRLQDSAHDATDTDQRDDARRDGTETTPHTTRLTSSSSDDAQGDLDDAQRDDRRRETTDDASEQEKGTLRLMSTAQGGRTPHTTRLTPSSWTTHDERTHDTRRQTRRCARLLTTR